MSLWSYLQMKDKHSDSKQALSNSQLERFDLRSECFISWGERPRLQ